MPIEWTDDLNIGVEEIDAQHREFHASVGEFLTTMRSGHRDRLPALLFYLDAYLPGFRRRRSRSAGAAEGSRFARPQYSRPIAGLAASISAPRCPTRASARYSPRVPPP